MLLSGVLLVLGLVALTGLLTAASLLTSETGREQSRPIAREAVALADGLEDAAALLFAEHGTAVCTGPKAHSDVNATVAHAERLARSHGYITQATACQGAPAIVFVLSDGAVSIRFKVDLVPATP